jgi:hypothetical protein
MEEDIQIDLESELVEISASLEKRKNSHDEFVKKQFEESIKAKNALRKFLKNNNINKLSEEELALIVNVCQKAHDACKQNIVNIKYSLSQNS